MKSLVGMIQIWVEFGGDVPAAMDGEVRNQLNNQWIDHRTFTKS
jgi:hypothetical protein